MAVSNTYQQEGAALAARDGRPLDVRLGGLERRESTASASAEQAAHVETRRTALRLISEAQSLRTGASAFASQMLAQHFGRLSAEGAR
jgi:hypothetical protein